MASQAQKVRQREARKRRKLKTKKALEEAAQIAARTASLDNKMASDEAIIAKLQLDLDSTRRELGNCQQQLVRLRATLDAEHNAYVQANAEAVREPARANELQDRLGKALKTIEQLQAQDIDSKSLRERLRKRGDEIGKLQTLLAQEKGKVEELRSRESKINFDRTNPPPTVG
jgi:chromosome segregation ATPase